METPAKDSSIRKIARIEGKPGKAEELRAALIRLEAATQAEPGCVEFFFFQSLTNEDSFVLLEHFANDQAFKEHLQLPHTQAFFQAQLVASVRAVDVPSL